MLSEFSIEHRAARLPLRLSGAGTPPGRNCPLCLAADPKLPYCWDEPLPGSIRISVDDIRHA